MSNNAGMSESHMGTTLDAIVLWHFYVPKNFLTAPNDAYSPSPCCVRKWEIGKFTD